MQMFMEVAGGQGGGGQARSNVDIDWKGALQRAVAKAMKRNLTKEDIVYTTSEVEGQKGRTQYQSVVVLSGESYAGEPCDGKKKAEQLAAKISLKMAYPTEFKAITGGSANSSETSWKQELSEALRKSLGRAIAKEDIVYETSEVADEGRNGSGEDGNQGNVPSKFPEGFASCGRGFAEVATKVATRHQAESRSSRTTRRKE